jgi:hypothetical protein
MYTKCDIECFSNINWENKFENLNLEQICEAFASESFQNVKKYVPRSKKNQGCKIKPLWMTGDTLKHIKTKRHAWNKYLTTRRHVDYEEYKHYSSVLIDVQLSFSDV